MPPLSPVTTTSAASRSTSPSTSPVAKRGDEPVGELVALAAGRLEARPALGDVAPGPHRDLAAVVRGLVDDRGDLGELVAEDVVQQEHRALDRAQPLEHEQERHRQRIGGSRSPRPGRARSGRSASGSGSHCPT